MAYTMWCGPNDGGIRRGEGAESGDNEARPSDGTGPGGSGVAGGESDSDEGHPTFDASALGGGPGGAEGEADLEEAGLGDSGGIDDLTIKSADDPSLGLTGTDDVPEEDWVADTGPTRTPEGEPNTSTGR